MICPPVVEAINPASDEPDEPQREPDSVSGPSALSVKQRAFALEYVTNGGKARDAALAAGYGESGAHVAANRCLVSPKVGAEILRLSRSLIHTALPLAIQALVEIVTDKEIKPEIRRKAAVDLLERGGMGSEKGGVHLNVGVQVNGQQAQALIGEVWDARSARMSGIPTAMADNMRMIEGAVERLEDDGRGGDQPQGPAPVPVALPPHSSENSTISEDDPLAAWREATKGDGDGE